MKLINYKRGYLEKFDCVIHGTIRVNPMEYAQFVYYLNIPSVKYDTKSHLKKDLERKINTKIGFLVNLRVSATERIVRHFKIKGYKPGNYMIEVIQ